MNDLVKSCIHKIMARLGLIGQERKVRNKECWPPPAPDVHIVHFPATMIWMSWGSMGQLRGSKLWMLEVQILVLHDFRWHEKPTCPNNNAHVGFPYSVFTTHLRPLSYLQWLRRTTCVQLRHTKIMKLIDASKAMCFRSGAPRSINTHVTGWASTLNRTHTNSIIKHSRASRQVPWLHGAPHQLPRAVYFLNTNCPIAIRNAKLLLPK